MALFKKKHRNEKRHYSESEKIEIYEFYQMLIKMKKNRPNLDIERIITNVFPNHDIDFKS